MCYEQMSSPKILIAGSDWRLHVAVNLRACPVVVVAVVIMFGVVAGAT